MIVVHEATTGVDVLWASWSDWRVGRRVPDWVWLGDFGGRPRGWADWCVACAGNGRIYAEARNGEGLIPVAPCPVCLGTGRDPAVPVRGPTPA